MASRSQFSLLRERRFAPLFWTQFLGAANDNLFKFAFTLLATYHAADWGGVDASTAGFAIGAIFIAPFVLLSATSGQIADKFERSRLIRFVKDFEIAVMAIAAAGFVARVPALLYVAVFLMGVHSTLFGPVKYAYLPQHLKDTELTGGNGMVEMGTFVAILLGTMASGFLVKSEAGAVGVAATCLAVAVLGRIAAGFVPQSPAPDPGLAINWNPFTETWNNLRIAARDTAVFHSLLGISWLWFVGSIFLTSFTPFTRDVLNGDENVVTALLAVFSTGIGLGALACERLSGRKVEIGLVPFGSIGMTVFAVDLWLACRGLAPGTMRDTATLLREWETVRIMADLFLVSLFAGFYSVPLYALIQSRGEPAHRARIIAANNILNARLHDRGLSRGHGAPARRPHAAAALPRRGAHERGRRRLHLPAGARVPDALPVLAARALGVPPAQGGHRAHPGGGRGGGGLQPRELRGRAGDPGGEPAADPLRDGPPHLPDSGALVRVPHGEGHPHRAREGGPGAPRARLRRGGGRPRAGRARGHLPRGADHGGRRDRPVPHGGHAHRRAHAGARGADGAQGALRRLLQPARAGRR